MQINVRLDTAVVDRLEAHAKLNRVSFSEEARQRLIDSLSPKPVPSLASFRVYFTSRLRDVIEDEARKDPEAAKKIEDDWRLLQRLDAMFSAFYGEVEVELDPKLKIPKVRELLRGAPSLSDETKSKATQE